MTTENTKKIQQNTEASFAYQTVNLTETLVQEPIEKILKKLSSKIRIDHPCTHTIKWLEAEPSILSYDACMREYEIFKARNRTSSTPTSFIVDANERNDVVLRPDGFTIRAHEDPKALSANKYGTKFGIVKTQSSDLPVLAMVAATLIAYTTKSTDKKSIDEVVTQARAKVLDVPYLNMVPVRQFVNVNGLNEKDTRDVIYEKLMKERNDLFYVLTGVYSQKGMERYREVNVAATKAYNDKRGDKLPPIRQVYFPVLGDTPIKGSSDIDVAWRFLLKSRGIRGADNRGIGSLTFGYMWWDMDRALFIDLSHFQDIFMCVRISKVEAVTVLDLSHRTIRMLVEAGVTVYCLKCSAEDQKVPCYANSGLKSYIVYYDMDTVTPSLTGSKVEYPDNSIPIKYVQNAIVPTFCAVYITKALITDKVYFYPSFRAHNGRCIISSHPSRTAIDDLVVRFVSANHVRNMFPYTRLSYYSQDPFMSSFQNDVVCPRNIPYRFDADEEKKAVSVILRDQKPRVIEYDITPIEQKKNEYSLEDYKAHFYQRIEDAPLDLRKIMLHEIINNQSDMAEYLTLLRYDNTYQLLNDSYIYEHYADIIQDNSIVIPTRDTIGPDPFFPEVARAQEEEIDDSDAFNVVTAKVVK